jgi:acyl-CoA synthetase (NDP forming)
VTKKKPVLVVKSGRTVAGARAASSHTGALAASEVAIDAVLEACGVSRSDTIEELFDLASALASQPLPHGDRVAILTHAGGPAIMATDAVIQQGLRLAELSAGTRRRLAAFLPPEASLANPVDMIASASDVNYGRAAKILLADRGVDAVLVINVTPVLYGPRTVWDALMAATAGAEKPVLSVFMANEEFYDEARSMPAHPRSTASRSLRPASSRRCGRSGNGRRSRAGHSDASACARRPSAASSSAAGAEAADISIRTTRSTCSKRRACPSRARPTSAARWTCRAAPARSVIPWC